MSAINNKVRLSTSRSTFKRLSVEQLPDGAIFLYSEPRDKDIWYMKAIGGVVNLQTGQFWDLLNASPTSFPRRIIQEGEAVEIVRTQ